MTHHSKAVSDVHMTGDGRFVASCGLDKIASVCLVNDAMLTTIVPTKAHTQVGE